MDRSGNPAGTEANTWKVLPRVASWMEFAELRFISITCHLSGDRSPYGWESQVRGGSRFPGCAGGSSRRGSLRGGEVCKQ